MHWQTQRKTLAFDGLPTTCMLHLLIECILLIDMVKNCSFLCNQILSQFLLNMIVNEHFVSCRLLCSYTLIYRLENDQVYWNTKRHAVMPFDILAPEYDEELWLYLLQSTVRKQTKWIRLLTVFLNNYLKHMVNIICLVQSVFNRVDEYYCVFLGSFLDMVEEVFALTMPSDFRKQTS